MSIEIRVHLLFEYVVARIVPGHRQGNYLRNARITELVPERRPRTMSLTEGPEEADGQ
jgi:hypothetical protein